MKGFTTMVSLRKYCSYSFVWMAAFFFLMCGPAKADTIYTGDMTIGVADPTQLGRLARDSVPSDWSAPKAFPGVINPTTSYHYTTLDLNLAALESGYDFGGYIQISFDSEFITTFLSAYLNSYSPLNLATNYLGDPGSSGNIFGNPLYFQVNVSSTDHLVLVLNETTTNGGLDLTGHLLVEAFTDTLYTDLTPSSTVPVPEPGTWELLLCGMALLLVARRLPSIRIPI